MLNKRIAFNLLYDGLISNIEKIYYYRFTYFLYILYVFFLTNVCNSTYKNKVADLPLINSYFVFFDDVIYKINAQ